MLLTVPTGILIIIAMFIIIVAIIVLVIVFSRRGIGGHQRLPSEYNPFEDGEPKK